MGKLGFECGDVQFWYDPPTGSVEVFCLNENAEMDCVATIPKSDVDRLGAFLVRVSREGDEHCGARGNT